MKRLALVAAVLALAACKPKDSGTTTSDSTATSTAPAMAPAPADTGMKGGAMKDTSMKGMADTGMKKADSGMGAMSDSTKKHHKKPAAAQ
jgi:hypothetical protein